MVVVGLRLRLGLCVYVCSYNKPYNRVTYNRCDKEYPAGVQRRQSLVVVVVVVGPFRPLCRDDHAAKCQANLKYKLL